MAAGTEPLRNEEVSLCKIMLNGRKLEYVTEVKYLGYMLCRRKVASGRKVNDTIKFQVNTR